MTIAGSRYARLKALGLRPPGFTYPGFDARPAFGAEDMDAIQTKMIWRDGYMQRAGYGMLVPAQDSNHLRSWDGCPSLDMHPPCAPRGPTRPGGQVAVTAGYSTELERARAAALQRERQIGYYKAGLAATAGLLGVLWLVYHVNWREGVSRAKSMRGKCSSATGRCHAERSGGISRFA